MHSQKKIVTVGKNGQISIGKEYAGRTLEIEYLDDGRALISPGTFLPDHQAPFFTEAAAEQLRRFAKWAEANPPEPTSSDELRSARQTKTSRKKAGS